MKTKPFNIEEAKAGAKVVNRIGNPVRIVCFDSEVTYKGRHQPIIDSLARTYSADGGFDCMNPDSGCDLLLVSEPRLRPWRPEEVPVGALARNKTGEARYLIVAAGPMGIGVGVGGVWVDFESTLDSREHSTDGGKTWKPCGVAE